MPYTSHALSLTSSTVASAASNIRMGSFANWKRSRYSRRRFISDLSSFHLLQEKIAKAKAKKTRTAATSFSRQELYRADHEANFSKESNRTARMKTTAATTKVIARSFQALLSIQVLRFGTLMDEAIRSKRRIITSRASWKRAVMGRDSNQSEKTNSRRREVSSDA